MILMKFGKRIDKGEMGIGLRRERGGSLGDSDPKCARGINGVRGGVVIRDD